jgi:hypothetical protein
VDPRASVDDSENRKFFPPAGFKLRPAASRYTECTLPAPIYDIYDIIMYKKHNNRVAPEVKARSGVTY